MDYILDEAGVTNTLSLSGDILTPILEVSEKQMGISFKTFIYLEISGGDMIGLLKFSFGIDSGFKWAKYDT